jgi:hypothetical protein
VSEPEQRPAHLRPATVEISRYWPPEVALAVFELIDDLRDKILALHGDQLRAPDQPRTEWPKRKRRCRG